MLLFQLLSVCHESVFVFSSLFIVDGNIHESSNQMAEIVVLQLSLIIIPGIFVRVISTLIIYLLLALFATHRNNADAGHSVLWEP